MMRWFIVIMTTCIFAAGCTQDENALRKMIQEELVRSQSRAIIDPMETIGPYSPGLRVGGFLFVSGQIGIDLESGNLVETGIEGETKKALENLNVVLRAAGYDSSHVVSTTVYLRNMEEYPLMNQIYGGYFQEGNYPARSTVSVVDLPRGANVEIAAVAFRAQEK